MLRDGTIQKTVNCGGASGQRCVMNIYFGEVIKKALSINLLFFWLILQGIYLTIRRYISQDTD